MEHHLQRLHRMDMNVMVIIFSILPHQFDSIMHFEQFEYPEKGAVSGSALKACAE